MSYELSVTRLGVYQTKGYLATDARMSYGLWVISYEAGRLPDKSLSCHRCTDELRVTSYQLRGWAYTGQKLILPQMHR